MSQSKPYKKQEMNKMSLSEPIMNITVNAQNRRMLDYVREDVRIGLEQYEWGEYEDAWAFTAEVRDDVRRAISGEELLNRLRPRIKELFQ